jgi:hypothetical protein
MQRGRAWDSGRFGCAPNKGSAYRDGGHKSEDPRDGMSGEPDGIDQNSQDDQREDGGSRFHDGWLPTSSTGRWT